MYPPLELTYTILPFSSPHELKDAKWPQAEEDILKLAHRTAGGQKDGPAREVKGARAETIRIRKTLENRLAQTLEEGPVRRDGVQPQGLAGHLSCLEGCFGEGNGLRRSHMEPAAPPPFVRAVPLRKL